MKTVSAPLAAHLDGEVTTLATCWKVTRTDGVVQGFTDHDRDLMVDGLVYLASSGYARTAITTSAGLAVDNLDLEGLLDSEAVTDEDLLAGRYNQASVEIFLVSWADPGMGVLRLRKGWLGEVRLEDGIYTAELRGLTQALGRQAVRVYKAECDADLGDHRCQVDLAQLTQSAEVESALDQRSLTVPPGALLGDTGWFDGGLVAWTSGANAGLRREVKRWDAEARTLTLWLPVPRAIAAGDGFTVHPGCDKRLSTCRTVFDNVANYRGFPFVPGQDRFVRIA